MPAHDTLGAAYLQKTMYKEATAEFEKAVAISPRTPEALVWLGCAYAVAGRRADAQRVLNQLNDLSKQKYVPAWSKAGIYMCLGEKDKAFEWLEKSYKEGSLLGIKVSPAWDPLCSDPRFADLLRRMNLQP
jgi:Flp pilus assembly protein TadD